MKRKHPALYFSLFCLLFFMSTACSTDMFAVQEEPPFVPEESLKEANDLIKDGFYEEAREVLEKVRTRDYSQQYSLLARIRIADTYFDEALYDEAAVEYEAFLDLYPFHKYSSYAKYRLAMSYFSRIGSADISYSWASKALNEFEELQRVYPRNPYMGIIDSRIKACINVLAEYEFYVGNFYYEKGSYNAAIGRFTGMIEKFPDSIKVPEGLYYTALSHESLGQREEAISFFTSLINDYPNIELSVEAKKIMSSFGIE